jgi:hypothetical protein
MALRRTSKVSFWNSVGRKVQDRLELFGKAKGMHDVGRAVYTGAQAVAPYLSTAAATAAALL